MIICGCTKYSLDRNTFIDTAKFNGYLISDTRSGYEKYDYIKSIYYAINQEEAYYIQYIELETDEYAKSFFEINKIELEKVVDSNTYVKRKNKNNYNLYHVENDSEYGLVIRCDNKIVYVSAPIEYINEIEEFLKELKLDY